MKMMSFRLTTLPFYRRYKWETRRSGSWSLVQPGELICGCLQTQGLRKNESVVRLALIRVVAAHNERLDAITQDSVIAEGFPDLTPSAFVEMYERHQPGAGESQVRVIQFEYLPGGRFDVPGICRFCTCVENEACWDEEHGACCWVDAQGRFAPHPTSVCSHCFFGWSQKMERVTDPFDPLTKVAPS